MSRPVGRMILIRARLECQEHWTLEVSKARAALSSAKEHVRFGPSPHMPQKNGKTVGMCGPAMAGGIRGSGAVTMRRLDLTTL